jgi:UDP-2-acetamido-2,6-beta-L-arabino-hexul-4-ose reductase
LCVHFGRTDEWERLPELLEQVDGVIHLAGENRPDHPSKYWDVNVGLTEAICEAIADVTNRLGRHIPLILASSRQAVNDNAYGRSKLAAESIVRAMQQQIKGSATIIRLPGVFGKWCRPNYNSVVATFCHNISRDLPVRIDNPDAVLNLVHVDDVVTSLLSALHLGDGVHEVTVPHEFTVSVGELAAQLSDFRTGKTSLKIDRVGDGFLRKLYSTYVSYLPAGHFAYSIPKHGDPRGIFVEMLKTPDCGQVSYFTAGPGVTRGNHYHHIKSEKFLVIQGSALFSFQDIRTGTRNEVKVTGTQPTIVDTVPGWAHAVTNIGDQELIVLLWANENFDKEHPDTHPWQTFP